MSEHIAVEGVRLAVRRTGPPGAGAGRRVLLLHGHGHTGAIWAPLALDLAADRRVLAVDRRGHGASEHRAAPPGEEARDYAALLLHDADAPEGQAGAPVAEAVPLPVDEPDVEPADEPDDDAVTARTDVVAEGDAIDVALALAVSRPDLVGRLVLVDGPRPGGRVPWAPWRRSVPPSGWTAGSSAPEAVLLVSAAPAGATAAQRLMRALQAGVPDPLAIRMVTVPGALDAPLETVPATVTTIVARFLRQP
jgi:pimeloyl-ACP methyl ester carboxylesterase